MPGHEEKDLSHLVKWPQGSGAMWLHMFSSAGFNNQCSFLFTQLSQHLGAKEWARREKEFDNPTELDAFAVLTVRKLDEHDGVLEKMENHKVLVDSWNMTREEFITMF